MQNFDEKAIIEQIRLLREQHAGSRGRTKFARTLGISGPVSYKYLILSHRYEQTDKERIS